MSAEILPYMGAVLVVGAAAVTWAARLAPSARPEDTAVFAEPVPGGRWLQCDELRCAHLTRLHLPVGDGRWKCTGCGTVKGGSS
ncbi:MULTISPECIES: hypothetical protein [unclassified Streptomyces]|uniref:hypothetical protein n=1 Tax=unclassified Streptomyces TaxID=2593676 RepID=UPI000BF004D6|nr:MULTISPECIES: hypothetical protein [unclassified Streptomyces]